MVFEGGILRSVALLAVKYWMSGRDLIVFIPRTVYLD